MENVLGGAAGGLPLALVAGVTPVVPRAGRLGEWVRGGGDEIGESWVATGGVLPLKRRRPLGWYSCDSNLCVVRDGGVLPSELCGGDELL